LLQFQPQASGSLLGQALGVGPPLCLQEKQNRQTTFRLLGQECCLKSGVSCSVQEHQHWGEAHVLANTLFAENYHLIQPETRSLT